ncbi:MAG: RnfABCDGE type electron transport complex subunit D, partial [Angelakisella sp.]
GTTNLLVLAACLLYLVMRRTVRIQQPAFMLGAMAAVAWFFPRTMATGWHSVFLELAAMPTLFFVTFMFNDPVTTPARGTTKALYAGVAGLVVMLFRHLGGYEIAEPFALLLMNGLSPAFDAVAELMNTIVRRAAFETQATTDQPSLGEDDEEA